MSCTKRKPMMVGNWKMNKTIAEAVVLAQDISNLYDPSWQKVDAAVCPPFIDIKAVSTVFDFDKTKVAVGAQNCYPAAQGAYTGEISVEMLASLNCAYCIVGHSERREYFGETDAFVNEKVQALLAAKISPIICVGESLAVRDTGDALDFVGKQLRCALAGLTEQEISQCVVAYEPIWAIGTGRTASPEQAQQVCASLREVVAAEAGEEVACALRILYGGSMKPENVEGLMAQPDIDGGLIGGAALDAASFKTLIEACING